MPDDHRHHSVTIAQPRAGHDAAAGDLLSRYGDGDDASHDSASPDSCPDDLAQRLAQTQAQLLVANRALAEERDANRRLKEASDHEREKLRQSEQERAHIMSSARCLLWYADIKENPDGGDLKWTAHFVDTDAAQRFLPVEMRPGEPYKSAWWRARLPEDREACTRISDGSVRAGKSYTQEFRCYAPDGSIRWHHEDIHVETVIEGERWLAVGVCTDVTDLKRAGQALRDSERLYRTIGEAVPDFVWSCGPNGEPLFANKRWTDYTGLALGEPSDVPMDVLHHPDDYPALSRAWTVARERGEGYSAEVRIRRYDGIYRWFLARAIPVLDEHGAITQWIGTTTDIHERKMAEDALRRSEAQHRLLTDAMPQLAWITASDGTPEYFNRRWYDYTGTTPDQLLHAERAKFVHPDDALEATARWNEALRTGQPYEMEYRLRGADGKFRWFVARGMPLRDDEGRVVRWFGTCTDIDQQRRAADKERFLADSSAALASSLDYETTLATVARLAVPHLADWCVVHIVEANATVRRLAVAHVDPEKVRWAEELQSRYPYEPDAQRGLPNVLRTGRSEFYPELSDEMLVAAARDDEHLAIMRKVGFTSAMIVPMSARGQVVGAISFVSAESGTPYDESVLAVAEDLAHSAALAVDNARSFRAAQEEIQRREETERELRRHQEEIDALNARLRQSVEVTHHHVRNNLQTILALAQIPMESGADTVPASALCRIGHHTTSLAAMHDLLMQRAREDADVGRLSAKTALERLIPLLQNGAGGRELRCRSDEITLPVQAIGSLCILVNELITNAIQHGRGTITLTVESDAEMARLEVEDDGPGFPPEFNWQEAAQTGLCLVDIAARHDLGGRVQFGNRPGGGGRVTVDFPIPS
jgi:PAS domain S-box-containing protein